MIGHSKKSQQIKGQSQYTPLFRGYNSKPPATEVHIDNGLLVYMGMTQDTPPRQCFVNGIRWNLDFHGTPTFAFLKPTRLFVSIILYDK
jgi:hypothetical protein